MGRSTGDVGRQERGFGRRVTPGTQQPREVEPAAAAAAAAAAGPGGSAAGSRRRRRRRGAQPAAVAATRAVCDVEGPSARRRRGRASTSPAAGPRRRRRPRASSGAPCRRRPPAGRRPARPRGRRSGARPAGPSSTGEPGSRAVSPGPERATRGASTARRGFEFGAVRDRALGQPVLAAVAGRGAVGHAHDLRSMRYVRWRRRRRRRGRLMWTPPWNHDPLRHARCGRLGGGRRAGEHREAVHGRLRIARAAASRCAARIEELPVFRLAWSERGAPRVILPVFRLAWSERGAPRRSCAAGGAPGAPGVCMRRRPAGAADAARGRRRNGLASTAASTSVRVARVSRACECNAGCRSCFPQSSPPSCSDRAARFAGKAFVQTSQDSLGWVGRVENVKPLRASPVELPSCATYI